MFTFYKMSAEDAPELYKEAAVLRQPAALNVPQFLEGSSKDREIMNIDRTGQRPLPGRRASAGEIVEGSGTGQLKSTMDNQQERSPIVVKGKGKDKERMIENEVEDMRKEDMEMGEITGDGTSDFETNSPEML